MQLCQVKGEIQAWIRQLQTDFWPKEPSDVKTLLELFLCDGRGFLDLDKEKMWENAGCGTSLLKPIPKLWCAPYKIP